MYIHLSFLPTLFLLTLLLLLYLLIILSAFLGELPNLPDGKEDDWEIPCAQRSKRNNRKRSPIPSDAEIISISDSDVDTNEKPSER